MMPTTTDQTASRFFVPPSLLRIRAFLSRRGLVVRPWANPWAVLGELHDVLAAPEQDAAFFAELEELVGALAEDLARRRHLGRRVVPNEWLSDVERAQLIAHLRAALTARDQGERRFARAAARLPGPAAATLCLIAGAVLAGCGGQLDRSSDPAPDAGHAAGGTGGALSGTGGQSAGGTGGVLIELPPPPFACDAGVPPLEAVLDACEVNATWKESTLACVQELNDSWQAGLEALLGCESCSDVRYHLECLLRACEHASLDNEFALEELLDHCVISIYVGVRPE